MTDGAVLILNFNYEPLNVSNLRRAMVMILGGRAEILANGRGYIHSVQRAWPIPSVIRLSYLVRRPLPRVHLCRREIFRRDSYTCQYCGRQTHNLTMDHVVPRHRGGEHTWENLVSACPVCNRRKGGKPLEQSNMRLLHRPFEPRPTGRYLFQAYLDENEEWGEFLQGWWE
jgi:5-methylcytosine-specific restriction endonuclease McrA